MSETERTPVIVTFKEKVEPNVILETAEAEGMAYTYASTMRVTDFTPDVEPEARGIVFETVNAISASLNEKAISKLKENPEIENVEPDTEIYAFDERMYIDPAAPTLVRPPLDRIVYPIFPIRCGYTDKTPWGVNRIDAERAWEVTQGKGIKVAVADTGIDYRHQDLRPNYKGGVSFVPTETSPMDYNSHGTHVAGTIAAARNCVGVVGVAPSAYLYAVKVLGAGGGGRWSFLLAGIEWCIRHRMDIVNMSLGASSAPTVMERVMDAAYKRGIILVAAAGNCRGGPVSYPARYRSVIAVSAIDSSNNWATFSCKGPEVELCAPGVNIDSTLPGNKYGTKSGTSMAAPHVTGTAALAISSHRYAINHAGPQIIRRLLQKTADNLGVPGRDPLFGFGVVDAEQTAFERRVP